MNWKLKLQPPVAKVRALEEGLRTKAGFFPRALAEVLVQRGINDLSSAHLYLQPALVPLHDPFGLLGMDRACERILAALSSNEGILLYGDYDVDGTTSVSLLYLFLRDLGFQFECYVPDRFKEGYGISFEGVEYAREMGCRLIVALDCGTKEFEKVRYARTLGIDVIVVDHHQPGPKIPEVVAMINPLQPGCDYPDKHLSACGLTLKLCMGLFERLPGNLRDLLPIDFDPMSSYGDLVALSTACDIVPLIAENRTLVARGLEKIRTNPLPGVAALKDLAAGEREWTVSDMVFYLGPRINSAGRLLHATEAVTLLTGQSSDLNSLAHALDALNEERKVQEREITKHGLEMIAAEEAISPRRTTVLFDPSWNKGIVGIVASRLIEHRHRPTILLTRSGGFLVGSGRSVPGFDLHQAIEACQEHLVQFGGHKYAAGLTLREEKFDGFKASFEAYVAANLGTESQVAELSIDCELPFVELSDRLVRILSRMAPFGPSNPEPVFVARGVEVKECKVLKEEHVRFLLGQQGVTLEAIGFFMADRWAQVNKLRLDIAYKPDLKTWNGKTYLQLVLKDIKAID